jgi:peptidyl-prolyl cis-trans isomerase D
MAKDNKQKKIITKKHLARKQREEKQTRFIIIGTIVIALLVVGLIGYGIVEQLILRPNKPVANVGDQNITVSQFESRVKYTRAQMLTQAYQYYQFYSLYGDLGQSFLEAAQSIAGQLIQPVTLGSDVLDEMINDIIIREEAAARGITVSSGEVDQALQDAFGFYPNGTLTPTVTATLQATPTYSKTELSLFPSTSTPTETVVPTETPNVTATPTTTEETQAAEETQGITEEPAESQTPDVSPTITLTPTITSTPTPFTTEVYAQDLRDFNDMYSEYNFTIDKLRAIYETDLLGEKLQAEITADMVPVAEQIWARHILVETEEEAQAVLDKLNAGEDWCTLAAEYSLDESNKDSCGDLGWFNRNTMVESFTDAAFSLDQGQISEPVETDYGWHIIQVIGKREAQIDPAQFEQDKADAFDAWLTEQRNSRDDIVIYDNWEDYVPTTPEISNDFLLSLYPNQ